MSDDIFKEDPEFFEEVDAFIAAQVDDVERIDEIAKLLPASFEEILEERATRVVDFSQAGSRNWGVIAASAAVAAAIVGIGALFLLHDPEEQAVPPVAADSKSGEMEFVVTILESGETEIETKPIDRSREPFGDAVVKGEAPGDEGERVSRVPVSDDDRFLKSPESAEPPQVSDQQWARTAIDRFVLATLDEHRIVPVPEADKLTLLRRISFDLTGLPPSPELVERFLPNQSPAAYGSVVDELMATWQFGEFWANRWLDSVGYKPGLPDAWRYREYVIASLNGDKPYNQFLQEQLAGDLNSAGSRGLIAGGFFAMAEPGGRDELVVQSVLGGIPWPVQNGERSVIASVFGGMRQVETVGLKLNAKKYPPMNLVEDEATETESKRLRGLIASTERRIERAQERRERDRVRRLRTELLDRRAKLLALEEGARDRVWSNGAQYLRAADPKNRQRLALAEELTDPGHPLTARVFVNRVWGELFGRGLMTSAAGASHPELLDYLAVKFVKDGWSTKSLVKQMMMSRTYQLSEVEVAENVAVDQSNRWLWRRTPREMNRGELRDSVHALADWLEPVGASKERLFARNEFKPLAELENPRQYRALYLGDSAVAEIDEELVFEAALAAARKMRRSSRKLGVEEGVRDVFVQVLGRQPSSGEFAWGVELISRAGTVESGGILGSVRRPDQLGARAIYLERLLPRVRVDGHHESSRSVSWAMLYHSLMMTDDFRIVR